MKIKSAYDEWSENYDSDTNLTRDLDHEVIKIVLSGREFKTILEIGCGTGKNTGFLSTICELLHAIDFSEGMLAKARSKNKQDNIRFSIADIKNTWPSEKNSCDLVTCSLVLEHIENLKWIFGEAKRVLKNKGMFHICELHPFRQYLGKKAEYRKSEKGSLNEIDAYIHHISDFLLSAEAEGFQLEKIKEWWHEKDAGKPPRLITFLFEKPGD